MREFSKSIQLLLITPLIVNVTSLVAAESAENESVENESIGAEWGVGIMGYANQGPQIDVDPESGALPFFYYKGERLSITFPDITYIVAGSEHFALSVAASGRFQGYDPDDSEFLRGMKERDPAFELGVKAELYNEWGTIVVSALTDVTGTHEGNEIDLSYQYQFQIDRWLNAIELGVSWQSSELADYYYGVSPSEAAVVNVNGKVLNRTAYTLGNTVTGHLGLSTMYLISDRWIALTGLEFSILDDAILQSPIVERGYEWGFITGVGYKF